MRSLLTLGLMLAAGACSRDAPAARAAVAARDTSATGSCRIVEQSRPLPAQLEESSGVAVSRAHSGVLWSFNDSGNDPVVYAVGVDGGLRGAVAVTDAKNHDWEDIALGPCASGGDCLYVADTGNNDQDRDDLTIYRFPEPDPRAEQTAPAERFRFRYPDGEHDSEALFVLPDGAIYLVTKGRHGRVSLYRYPGAPKSGSEAVLVHVADLTEHAPDRPALVTGADASPSGRWVAIRTYGSLSVYRAAALTTGDVAPEMTVDLTPVGEMQGEGVALLDNGRVVLTSEAGSKHLPATIAVLSCPLTGR